MAQGNWVQGGSGYRKYCWCAYVDVAEVGRTDTTVTYRVTHGYGTRYAIDCYANGSSSAGSSWNGSVYSTNNSGWVWVQCTSRDVELARGNGAPQLGHPAQRPLRLMALRAVRLIKHQ